jgi:tRNA threonylcarbamoyladenosine biosynthesis protein TsaE
MPDANRRLELRLPDEAATARLGATLARAAAPGDWLALEGALGAGKTHLARAFIRERLAMAGEPPEEVPSPSYTLVQSYLAGGTDIIHADLYRLGGPEEVAELGLDPDAANALTLVEWPDRLGEHLPPRALCVVLEMSGTGRRARLSVPSARGALIDTLRAQFPNAKESPGA